MLVSKLGESLRSGPSMSIASSSRLIRINGSIRRIFRVQSSAAINIQKKLLVLMSTTKALIASHQNKRQDKSIFLQRSTLTLFDQRSISRNSCTDPVIIYYNTITYTILVNIVLKLTLPWRRTPIVSISARLEVH